MSLRHSVKPACGAPRLAVRADQVDVEVGGVGEALAVDLGVPVLVEPGAAEGVDHGGQRGQHLTPPGLTAQADALHVRLGAVELRRQVRDLLPGRLLRHGQTLGLQDVLAVHEEGGLAVERLAVDLVVHRERLGHRLEDVALVEAAVLADRRAHRGQPAVLRVERDLEVRQRGDVVLAGLAGELLAGLVPQVVLREHGEVDRDAGLLGEVGRGQLLQVDHLRVVDHQDAQRPAPAAGAASASAAPAAGATARGQRHSQRHADDPRPPRPRSGHEPPPLLG
jgi:hypothetical protein